MSETDVRSVFAWEALDSRGRPTVGCRIELAGGGRGRVIVPSGASTGRHEAVELRDGGARYAGLGVRQAVASVNDVYAPMLRGMSVADRTEIDALMEATDGDRNLGRLGANAALAVSLASTIALADACDVPLWQSLLGDDSVPLMPMPMVNIFSGGAHADRAIDIQDLLVVPVGATSFAVAIEWADRVRAASATLLENAGGWAALVADEGGLSARLPTTEDALTLLTRGIEDAGFEPGSDCAIAIDVAASQLSQGTDLRLAAEDRTYSNAEWVDKLAGWLTDFPIVSIEDVLDEDDWDGWSGAQRAFSGIQLVGDDLFCTDASRLATGIARAAANAVLVKVNQAGTVSRAEDVVRAAQQAGIATVVSARSGDTEDHWLSDFAVGWRAGQIKVGSTMRSERTAKWNRLLEIEASTPTVFAGGTVLAGRSTPR